MRISLVRPDKIYEKAALELKEEFFAFGEEVINGSALLDKLDYDEWLAHLRNNECESTVSDGWVESETFFAVNENGRIVGIIDFRHNLNTAFLSEFGGHVGYAVRPTERRKGYCTQMLNLIKKHAAKMGVKNLMLSCYADNTASLKTMLKCGGKIARIKNYVDGKPMCIVWIDS